MISNYAVIHEDQDGSFDGTIYYTPTYAKRIFEESLEAGMKNVRLVLITILESEVSR